MSGVTKLVPAKLRSSPRIRSSSSGCPIDSWICRIIWSGHQQHVHRAARAVRRGEQLERLVGDAAHRAVEAEAREDLVAALLADAAMAVQRARLRVAVGVRGDRHAREQEAVALDDVAALAGDEPVRRGQHVDRRVPVDDARVERRRARFAHQQFVPLAARARRGRECRRRVFAARPPGGAACASRPARTSRWRAPAPPRARAPPRRPAGDVSPVAA